MKASTIKHILPQVIPKLEYKHYTLALVLDTINGLANTSQHSDSGEFTNVLAHIIGGIRFLGLVDKNGDRHFSDTYRINGLRYFVRMA